MMTFAFCLRMWRQRRQLSQVALSHRTGITQATLSRLELNQEKPRWETMQRLASALRIEAPELLAHKPLPQLKLDKFELDAVARAILSGDRKLSPVLSTLADQIASLMINKMRAHQAPGLRRVQSLRPLAPFRKMRLSVEIPDQIREQILIRADKLLSLYSGKIKFPSEKK